MKVSVITATSYYDPRIRRHAMKDSIDPAKLKTVSFLEKRETGALLDYYVKIGHIYQSKLMHS